ncbi:MAG: hypothetical protein IJA69_00190 [Clostridia bacterium]|nr:hypothetical protein [Clostridia bacterium]
MNEKTFIKENTLTLENRNHLVVSGVEKVISFSPTCVCFVAMNANCVIQGEQLQAEKLDVDNGILELFGIVNQIKYETKKEKIPFLKRIFK